MSFEPAITPRPRDLAAMRRRAVRVRDAQRGPQAAPQPEARPTRIGLWLPLTPLFWLLAPFVVLMAPVLLLAPPLWRMNPYVTVFRVGRVLLALGGTDIDVDTPDARVRLKIL